MEVKNALAKNLETIEKEKVSLDSACKKLLANKSILAWIMKECVEEYRECSLEEIESKYIEGHPKVSREAVHQDESLSVKGTCNEDTSMIEGTVTYDIRFRALAPYAANGRNKSAHTGKAVNLNIDVEGQTDFYPGYPLPKRGIYYGSRMISSQYGKVFTNSHYEKIEKVYSIWVCIAPPRYKSNSINVYKFHEDQLYGKAKEKRQNYDLITVVMIYLGDEEAEECRGLLRLLSVLLSERKCAEEKKRILETEFGIAMMRKLEEEVEEMCNYSDYVEREATKRGMKKGIEMGIEKGMTKGIEKGIFSAIRNLVKNTDMTLEQVMKVLEIPENEKAVYVGKVLSGDNG